MQGYQDGPGPPGDPERPAGTSTELPGGRTSSSTQRRSWRACEICRKRKIKCDGDFPCSFCALNDKICDYKVVNDNAASHRAQAAAVADRLERLEDMMERLLPLVGLVRDLGSSISAIKRENALRESTPSLSNAKGEGPSHRVFQPPEEQKAGIYEPHGYRDGFANLPQRAMSHSAVGLRTDAVGRNGHWNSGAMMSPVGLSVASVQSSVPTYYGGYVDRVEGLPGSSNGISSVPAESRRLSGPIRHPELQAWGSGSQTRQPLADQGFQTGSNDIFSPMATGHPMSGPAPAPNGSSESAQHRDPRDPRDHRNTSPSRYGPKESQSTMQEREGQPPAIWQERLAGRLAQDSRGHMKFHGGPATFLFSDAVAALKNPAENPPDVEGRNAASSDSISDGTIDLDELYFKPWAQFRNLRGLPPPDQARFPHSRICDFLVQTYFDRLHPLFPIIDRPTFMFKYSETMAMRANGAFGADSTFLCLLFSVFTATAQVVRNHMREKEGLNWSLQTVGLEMYEQALYLNWYHTGDLGIEHITSYALLASTMAGWNSLSQAWIFAGQACRAAQDLGLHRSPERLQLSAQAKAHRRVVWWCVYGLDRALSISTGRPMACNDADSDVEYPRGSPGDPQFWDDPSRTEEADRMTAFIELTRVYALAGAVEREAHSLQSIRGYDDPSQAQKLRAVVDGLDADMDAWVKCLPDCVRLAENIPATRSVFLLAMLGRITLFAATINLHRPFIPEQIGQNQDTTSLMKCISAAKGCIYAGGQIKDIIPASHHCQFLVHYLTISAAILLRCTSWLTDLDLATDMIKEADSCYNILLELETTWRGAEKSAYIVHKLLRLCKVRLNEQQRGKPPRSLTPHKRARLNSGLDQDHVAKRSRHSPPVDGLPTPTFETISSGYHAVDSALTGLVRSTDNLTMPQGPDLHYVVPGYDATTGQENLSNMLDSFLADSTNGRSLAGYPHLGIPSASTITPDPAVLQNQQPAFRKALYDNSFLYEF